MSSDSTPVYHLPLLSLFLFLYLCHYIQSVPLTKMEKRGGAVLKNNTNPRSKGPTIKEGKEGSK